MVKFKDNRMSIDGKEVIFFTEIDDILDLGEKIIVKVFSTSPFVDYQVKDNIFAINRSGEILWQVKTPYLYWLDKSIPQIYFNIKYIDNKLLAQNGGSVYDININTGEILDRWDDPSRDKA